jgi:predicted ribosome quality control (RQC) complex YloA/Tae2 family protein
MRAERRTRIRDGFRRVIAAEERRLVRLHSHLKGENEAATEAPTLRRSAEALLIHVSEIPRGAKRFTCPDPHDPSATLEIDLDPKRSASANADILFRRARRLDRGEPLRARRLAAIDAAAARLSHLRLRVDSDTDALARGGTDPLKEALGPFSRAEVLRSWKSIGDEVPPARRETPPPSRPQGAPARRRAQENRFHPRTYKTREGWTILVGRSNEENDYVTHALAKPDDYWFHAHGCPGSHVVLRREGRKDNPSVRTIEEAASIAAWFSKARTSKRAPIVYTLKKYVRRPRKGPAGLALITREKTILIAPKAPADAEPGGWGDEED